MSKANNRRGISRPDSHGISQLVSPDSVSPVLSSFGPATAPPNLRTPPKVRHAPAPPKVRQTPAPLVPLPVRHAPAFPVPLPVRHAPVPPVPLSVRHALVPLVPLPVRQSLARPVRVPTLVLLKMVPAPAGPQPEIRTRWTEWASMREQPTMWPWRKPTDQRRARPATQWRPDRSAQRWWWRPLLHRCHRRQRRMLQQRLFLWCPAHPARG